MQEVECVFIGRREIAGGKTGEAWITLDKLRANLAAKFEDVDETGAFFAERLFKGIDYSLFAASKGNAPLICGVYTVNVEMDANGKVRQLGFKKSFTGRRLDNDAFNNAAYIEDKAVGLTLKAERQLIKMKAENPLENELHYLRALYRKTSPENRLAVEVLVLKALRHGI